MNLCDYNHEEVVYTSRHCPLCAAADEINDLVTQVGRLEADIEKMKEEQN